MTESALLDRFGAGREAEHYQWALEDFKRVAGMRSGLLDVYQIFGDTQIGGGDAVSILRAYENMLAMHPEEGRDRRDRGPEAQPPARADRRAGVILPVAGARLPSPSDACRQVSGVAGAPLLVAGAIAAYVSLMSVELVPAIDGTSGRVRPRLPPRPRSGVGLTVAAAVVTLGLDRAITFGRSICGRSG